MADADRQLLERWNFLRGYQNNWQTLVSVPQAEFRARRTAGVSSPRPTEMVEGIAVALLANYVFMELCTAKRDYLDPTLDLTMARAMARYMLDHDWPVIVG